jgi:hypothetical protein
VITCYKCRLVFTKWLSKKSYVATLSKLNRFLTFEQYAYSSSNFIQYLPGVGHYLVLDRRIEFDVTANYSSIPMFVKVIL